MTDRSLILSIIKFLVNESKREDFNYDTKESLEVAVQCLQTAYDINPNDPSLVHLQVDTPLSDIFNRAVASNLKHKAESSEAMERAEAFKEKGNTFMKSRQYTDALKSYTSAIELDGNNAIYYGNRAVAYVRLNDFENAIKDCEQAIAIDPNYAKAYGRLGIAYGALEQHDKAIKYLEKAIELDPENEDYKMCLQKEREKNGQNAAHASGPNLANSDFQNFFSNPLFRNVASSLMQDPSVLDAINSLPRSPGNSSSGSSSDGASFLDAARYFATQIQASNPDLMEQIRDSLGMRNSNPQSGDRAPDSSKD